jgi:DNA-binding XRE family transcriptional regulator
MNFKHKGWQFTYSFLMIPPMATKRLFKESELAALARAYRIKAGKGRVEAAKMLKVTRPTMHLAEENPQESLTKLRCRIIEKFSPFKITGPFFRLQRK